MVAARRLDILSRQPEGSSGRPPKNRLNPLSRPVRSPTTITQYRRACSKFRVESFMNETNLDYI